MEGGSKSSNLEIFSNSKVNQENGKQDSMTNLEVQTKIKQNGIL
jgi:hypothetical protein